MLACGMGDRRPRSLCSLARENPRAPARLAAGGVARSAWRLTALLIWTLDHSSRPFPDCLPYDRGAGRGADARSPRTAFCYSRSDRKEAYPFVMVALLGI